VAHNLREHDSMLAVGETPWHNLGVTLAEPPSSGEEALRIAKMDWQVAREPLFLANGMRAVVSGSVSRQNDGQYAMMVRQDTQDKLGVVGPSYVPYQNSQMAELFNPLIQDGSVSIETCGSLFNGRRVWMLAKFGGENMEIEKGDDIARYLLLAHGHDGCFAVRFGICPVRVVCWNTLSAAVGGESESKLIRCLHTTNLESNLELIRGAMVLADETFQFTAEQYRLLASRGVSRADLREYARIIVKAPAEEKDWTSGERSKIGTIIGAAVEGCGNNGRTWWSGYNGVTEYLTWNRCKKVDNRLDSLWFGDSAKVSQRALELALQMSA